MVFRKQEKFTWWMPRKMLRFTVYGTPQTKLRWMMGTWRSYIAYWKLYIAVTECLLEQTKQEVEG